MTSRDVTVVAARPRYVGALLRGPESVCVNSRLLAADELDVLRKAIERELEPATSDEVKAFVAMLAAKWAQEMPKDAAKLYMAAMRDRLMRYPLKILDRVGDEAVDLFKWRPATAEVVQIAEELMAPLRRQLSTIEAMEAEHERRRQDASRREQRQRELAEAGPRLQRAAASRPAQAPRLIAAAQDDGQLAHEYLMQTGRCDELTALWQGLQDEDPAMIAKAASLAEQERRRRHARRYR